MSTGDGGFGVDLEWSEIEKPREFMVEHSLPGNCASSVSLDLFVKKETKPAELIAVRHALTEAIRLHLEPELKRTPHFHAFRVLKAQTGEGQCRNQT